MTIQDITILPTSSEVRKIDPKWRFYEGCEISLSNDPKKKEWIKDIDAINVGDIVFASMFTKEYYAGIITEKNGTQAEATVKIANSNYYWQLEFAKDDRLCWVNTCIRAINENCLVSVLIV